jgi:hypothetical protein
MKDEALLPGVQGRSGARVSATFDGREAVRKARQREDLRDLIDLLVLAFVDGLMLWWDAAHIPWLSRAATLKVMLVVSAGMAAFLLLRRLIPVLTAKRIESTWKK